MKAGLILTEYLIEFQILFFISQKLYQIDQTCFIFCILLFQWRFVSLFQLNTFQAVIITDGVYAFVMFNYPKDGIQWSAPTSV